MITQFLMTLTRYYIIYNLSQATAFSCRFIELLVRSAASPFSCLPETQGNQLIYVYWKAIQG